VRSAYSHRVYLASIWLTLRSTPSALSDIETAVCSPGVCLACYRIYEQLLCLHDRSRLAFIIHSKDLASDLKLPAFGRNGYRLEELNFALAVKDMLAIELGYALDRRCGRACIEVYDFLVGVFE
jgi:hypothetical protein